VTEPRQTSAHLALAARSGRHLLVALLTGEHLMAVVPATLVIVERDPLASGGSFRGDLIRGLMEISGLFWGRQPRLYERYVAALRAAAVARRPLPRDERMEFWTPLTLETLGVAPRDAPDATSTIPTTTENI
jgi:hypothetical protein